MSINKRFIEELLMQQANNAVKYKAQVQRVQNGMAKLRQCENALSALQHKYDKLAIQLQETNEKLKEKEDDFKACFAANSTRKSQRPRRKPSKLKNYV